jgi:hypothetical protein
MVLLPGCECCGCSQDACECPDFCAYTASGSFAGLSANAGQCSCSSSSKIDLKSNSSFAYGGLISGWTLVSAQTRFGASVSRSSRVVGVGGRSSAVYRIYHGPFDYEELSCGASDETSFRCENNPGYPGSYELFRARSALATYLDTRITSFSSFCDYEVGKSQSFSVSLSCQAMGDRSCSTALSADCRRYFTEPFDLPLLTSASSGSGSGQSSYPSQFDYVKGVAESIFSAIDASPVTGTIGLFESCNPLP